MTYFNLTDFTRLTKKYKLLWAYVAQDKNKSLHFCIKGENHPESYIIDGPYDQDSLLSVIQIIYKSDPYEYIMSKPMAIYRDNRIIDFHIISFEYIEFLLEQNNFEKPVDFMISSLRPADVLPKGEDYYISLHFSVDFDFHRPIIQFFDNFKLSVINVLIEKYPLLRLCFMNKIIESLKAACNGILEAENTINQFEKDIDMYTNLPGIDYRSEDALLFALAERQIGDNND